MSPNSCQQCHNTRIIYASAKCSDLCSVQFGASEHQGYVPECLNIGGGDYVEFAFCIDCGQMQGDFPIPESVTKAAFPELESKEN